MAQNYDILEAEYFIDTDPGNGNATPINITVGPTLNKNFSIPTNGLAPGFHFLFIRVKSATINNPEIWSLVEGRLFYIQDAVTGGTSPNVTVAEYFIDTDPGVGNATAISITNGATINQSLSISTNNLSSGFHFLFVRVKDANNTWSLVEGRLFYIQDAVTGGTSPNLTAAEYFIDTDPGVGNATAISVSAGAIVDKSLSIPINNLSNGTHFLAVRVKDANNTWSLMEAREFTVQGGGFSEIAFTSTLGFGNVLVNTTSASKSLIISNLGDAPLEVNSVSYPTGFSGDFSSGTIAPNTAQVVNVSFSPTAAVAYKDSIRITSNANSGISKILVSGKGILPPACLAASAPLISNITQAGASLAWTGSASAYEVQYKLATISTWTTVPVNTNQLILNNLYAGMPYQWRVRTKCETIFSTYINGQAFITLGSVACATPSGLSSSNLGNTMATLSWAGVSGALSYQVQYKPSLASTWTTITINANSLNLNNLLSGTTYQFRVRTLCAADNSLLSFFSPIATFITLGATACTTPSNLLASAITDNTAQLSWTNASATTSYDVQYKPSAASTWITVNVVATQLDLNNLLTGTAYQFRVRSRCSNGLNSVYSAIKTFITGGSAVCLAPGAWLSNNITETSATISWTTSEGNTWYDVQYRLANVAAWTSVSLPVSSLKLSGLYSGMVYQWHIRARCDLSTTLFTAYSPIQSFTTAGAIACANPSNLQAQHLSANGVTFTWANSSGTLVYDVQYKIGTAAWITTLSNTNALTLSGLTAGSVVQARVRARCNSSASLVSAFTAILKVILPNSLVGGAAEAQMEAEQLTESTPEDFKVYPNPSQDFMQIEVPILSEKSQRFDVQVVNSNGKEVYQKSNQTNQSLHLDVRNFAKGIYFLKITLRNGKQLTKKMAVW